MKGRFGNIPDDKDSGLFNQLVLLASRLEVDLSPNGIPQVNLAVDHI